MSLLERTTITDDLGAVIDTSERRLYDIDELKAGGEGIESDAYLHALDWVREGSIEYDWFTTTIEDLVDDVDAKYGIKYDPKQVQFDLERGSYVCLGKSTDVDERKVLKAAKVDLRTKLAREIIDDASLILYESHGYGANRGGIGVSQYDGWPDYLPEWVTDAIDSVLEAAEDLVLTALREEFDYITGDEYNEEIARINEYTFTSRGRRA